MKKQLAESFSKVKPQLTSFYQKLNIYPSVLKLRAFSNSPVILTPIYRGKNLLFTPFRASAPQVNSAKNPSLMLRTVSRDLSPSLRSG
jgi:hypothetical protein